VGSFVLVLMLLWGNVKMVFTFLSGLIERFGGDLVMLFYVSRVRDYVLVGGLGSCGWVVIVDVCEVGC